MSAPSEDEFSGRSANSRGCRGLASASHRGLLKESSEDPTKLLLESAKFSDRVTFYHV
jgi:hypothetical protein